jgi:hypothetical protein
MSKGLKWLFLIHTVVAAIFGLALLLAPGQFLGAIGWAPVDPIASRLLGAALLALGWSSFRGWRATDRAEVAILVEMEAVFTVLCSVGLLRHLVRGGFPFMVWAVFAIFFIFAIAWIVFLVRRE